MFTVLGFQPVPLLLGFVLGPLAEENLRRAMLIADGDPMTFIHRPVSLAIIVVLAGMIATTLLPAFRARRSVFDQN